MPKLRVHAMSVSLDGCAAGPDQGPDHPLGVGGEALHTWAFATATFHRMLGRAGGTTGVDDEMLRRGEEGIGATIMGRNMFGPVRGPWDGDDWTGWWGPEPPYHHPVFVLTHHARDPVEMAGGTTFTSSPTASSPRWSRRSLRPVAWTSGWAADRPPCSSTCARAWSTSCTSPSCRCCSAGASGSSTTCREHRRWSAPRSSRRRPWRTSAWCAASW